MLFSCFLVITGLNKPKLGFFKSGTASYAPLGRPPSRLWYNFVTNDWAV